jgi:excisionase family DNA binding protein
MTVKEVAQQLNVPVETVQSWIESEVIQETEKGIPAEQFADRMSDELQKEMAILQQKVLARDED